MENEEKLIQKNHEIESHEYLTNESQKPTGADRLRKNSKAGSPSHEPASSVAQQYIPTVQWPYLTQTSAEHSLSRPFLTMQQNSPTVITQRPSSFLTPHQQQLASMSHHLPQGQLQVTPSSGPFWLPPRPGFQAAGPPFQPFVPTGATDSSWQAPIVVGASTGSESISSYSFQSGYYPMGCAGSWYPPSLWGQPQQAQPPYSLHYPACSGGFGYFALPTSSAENLSFGQPHQRGIIQLQAKLSQKHQRIWEAQSAENVYLRTAIGRVEAELATCRNRLAKLEAEVSCLKAQRDPVADGSAGAAAVFPTQQAKRGRPKRPIASVSSVPFTDDLQPKPRGRKPTSCKAESEAKGLISEKENANKEEGTSNTSQSMLGIGRVSNQGENDGKISTNCMNGCTSNLSGSKPKLSPDIQTISSFQNKVHYGPRVQISPVSLTPAVGVKCPDDKEESQKTPSLIPSQCSKGPDSVGTGNESHGWQSNILTDDIRSHSFFDSTSIIKQEGKMFNGWSFVNQDASEDQDEQDDMVGSGKDDDDEMDEDVSSAADEMSQAKTEGSFPIDPSAVPSTNALPQVNRW